MFWHLSQHDHEAGPDGIRLTTADPEFETQIDVARRVMRERRAVQRELAK